MNIRPGDYHAIIQQLQAIACAHTAGNVKLAKDLQDELCVEVINSVVASLFTPDIQETAPLVDSWPAAACAMAYTSTLLWRISDGRNEESQITHEAPS